MNQLRFVQERRSIWLELEAILSRAQKTGLRSLSDDEVEKLGRLYRLAVSHLAAALSYFPSSDTAVYLNQLVAQAHATIYRAESISLKKALNFLKFEFSALFQKRLKYIVASFLIFLVAALSGFFGTSIESDLPRIVVGNSYIDMTEANIASGEPVAVYKQGFRPLSSSLIMTNNISIMLRAFSFGIFFGAGSVLILIFNGLMFGCIAHIFYQYGYSLEFFSTVMIHGTIELTCVFIGGGAGLLLGSALINPGDLSRKDALILNGKEASKLIVGIVPWLVIAAIIEGFITPIGLPLLARSAVIIVSGAAFFRYLFGKGLRKESWERNLRKGSGKKI